MGDEKGINIDARLQSLMPSGTPELIACSFTVPPPQVDCLVLSKYVAVTTLHYTRVT